MKKKLSLFMALSLGLYSISAVPLTASAVSTDEIKEAVQVSDVPHPVSVQTTAVSSAWIPMATTTTATSSEYIPTPTKITTNENGETVCQTEIRVDTTGVDYLASMVEGVDVHFYEYEKDPTVDNTAEPIRELFSLTTTDSAYITPEFVLIPDHYYVLSCPKLPDGWRTAYYGEGSFIKSASGDFLAHYDDVFFNVFLENKEPYPVWEYPVSGNTEFSFGIHDYSSYIDYMNKRVDKIGYVKDMELELVSVEMGDDEDWTIGETIKKWNTTDTPLLTINYDYNFENKDDNIYFGIKINSYPESYSESIANFGYHNLVMEKPYNDYYIIEFNAEAVRKGNAEFIPMIKENNVAYVTTMSSAVNTASTPTNSTTTAVDSETSSGATLIGDANCDGGVNIADATAIVQHIGNTDRYALSEQGLKNADCYNTGDGITGMDAMAIQKLEAKKIDSLPLIAEKETGQPTTAVNSSSLENIADSDYVEKYTATIEVVDSKTGKRLNGANLQFIERKADIENYTHLFDTWNTTQENPFTIEFDCHSKDPMRYYYGVNIIHIPTGYSRQSYPDDIFTTGSKYNEDFDMDLYEKSVTVDDDAKTMTFTIYLEPLELPTTTTASAAVTTVSKTSVASTPSERLEMVYYNYTETYTATVEIVDSKTSEPIDNVQLKFIEENAREHSYTDLSDI